MGFKCFIRKCAKFILSSTNGKVINVNISQIKYNEILKGKNIVITGGGKGLGLSMAEKFVSEGATVVIIGRNEKNLKEACEKIGKDIEYIKYDVKDIKNINNLFIKCEKKLKGKIDTLVCNAGVSLHENIFTNVTEETFDEQFDTNFKSTFFFSKCFLEYCEENQIKNGNLLIITSESANQNYDTPYGLTKNALNSLIGALSRRVYKQNIRVNGIAPGVTASDMTKGYADVSDGNMYRDCASDRVFLPEEVSEVACFLLSDAAKCISGEIIHTNAGNHLNPFWKE